jgi:hypothetical protein
MFRFGRLLLKWAGVSYIISIILVPLVAFPTRISLIAGAFLLGMFLASQSHMIERGLIVRTERGGAMGLRLDLADCRRTSQRWRARLGSADMDYAKPARDRGQHHLGSDPGGDCSVVERLWPQCVLGECAASALT